MPARFQIALQPFLSSVYFYKVDGKPVSCHYNANCPSDDASSAIASSVYNKGVFLSPEETGML